MHLGWETSIDEDEYILLIRVDDGPVAKGLADAGDMPIAVTKLAYRMLGFFIPTVPCPRGGEEDCLFYANYSLHLAERFKKESAYRLDKLPQVVKLIRDKLNKQTIPDNGTEQTLHSQSKNKDNLVFAQPLADFCEDVLLAELRNVDVPDLLLGAFLKEIDEESDEAEKKKLTFCFNYMCVMTEKQDATTLKEMQHLEKTKDKEAVFAERRRIYVELKDDAELRKVELFAPFREIDLCRIVLQNFDVNFDRDVLLEQGIIKSAFVKHDYAALQGDIENEFAKPTAVFQPPLKHLCLARDYFGEATAFFFHFIGFWTMRLGVLAILGVIYGLRTFYMPPKFELQAKCIYTVMAIVWISFFSKQYLVFATERAHVWGTANCAALEPDRLEFEPKYIHSLRERFWRGLHWALAILIFIESVGFAFGLNGWRVAKAQSEQKKIGPLSKTLALKLAKFGIIINIKIMNALWEFLSPLIGKRGNWKKDSNLQTQLQTKSLFVKFIVYFYPFIYSAFIGPFVEGCGDEGKPGDVEHFADCILALRTDLLTTFATNVATAIVMLIIPTFLAWREIKAEIAHAKEKAPHKVFTYDQLQAKLPDYPGEYQDLVDVNVSIGYVILFAVVSPFLPLVAFLAMTLQQRLIAYRNCFVSKRSNLQMSPSAGMMGEVPGMMVVIAIVTNTLLIFFMGHESKIQTTEKLKEGLGIEHLILLLFGVTAMVFQPNQDTLAKALEENGAFQDVLLYGQDPDEDIPQGKVAKLARTTLSPPDEGKDQ